MTGIYHNLKFLVVEDDEITATSLSAMLLNYGACGVMTAHSSEEACNLLERMDGIPFNAAIVDIDLGGTDCFEVSRALRQAGIPFLFHSGRSGDYPHLLQEFPVPFVGKPSTDFDVIFALEKVMGWPAKPDGTLPPSAAA